MLFRTYLSYFSLVLLNAVHYVASNRSGDSLTQPRLAHPHHIHHGAALEDQHLLTTQFSFIIEGIV